MSRFIETILIKEGRPLNLPWHQMRVARTFNRFFSRRPIELASHLHKLPQNGTHRCRLTYTDRLENVEFFPYEQLKKTKLLALESDLNYNYKFASRTGLEALAQTAKNAGCDDALIIRNGLVADTTIANIALFDGRRWLTPSQPLLRGTARERLLAAGMICRGRIRADQLERFSHFALFNALSGFYVAGSIDKIVR